MAKMKWALVFIIVCYAVMAVCLYLFTRTDEDASIQTECMDGGYVDENGVTQDSDVIEDDEYVRYIDTIICPNE